jgi:hypothetical protein
MRLHILLPLIAFALPIAGVSTLATGCGMFEDDKKKKKDDDDDDKKDDDDEDEDDEDDDDDDDEDEDDDRDEDEDDDEDEKDRDDDDDRGARGAGGGGDVVDAIEEMSADYCDCKTQKCVEKVAEKWEDADSDFEDSDMEGLSQRDQERVGAAMGEMMGCMMSIGMSGE